MANLREALHLERSRLFVGRRKELDYVEAWLQQPCPATRLVVVSGIGGIGKSALLLKFLARFQAAGARCVWLDGRTVAESPGGFLDALHTALFRTAPGRADRSPAAATVETIAAELRGERTLLCIDNYESLSKLEDWLRDIFLPELPAEELLIVLSGRQPLSADWHHDIAWRGRLRPMPLGCLTNAEADSYFVGSGVDEKRRRDTFVRETRGYPLAMALCVEKAEPLQHPAVRDEAWPVSRLISARLLREVVSPQLQEAVDVLSILPAAPLELLSRLLRSPLHGRQLEQLTQLSFVRPAPQGIALHEVARAYLLDDFRQREPERFRTLRRLIVRDACLALRQAEPHERNDIAAMLLIICQDALPRDAFYRNPTAASFSRYRAGDLPWLHRLLDEQQVQKAIPLQAEADAHRFLDKLVERNPEHVRVYRSEQGVPLVFHAGLPLYEDTCRFLDELFPGLVAACYPGEKRRLGELRREQADIYLHLLGGADHHDSAHTAQELYDLMFTDGFSSILSMGLRMALVPTNEQLRRRFESLGFAARPLAGLPAAHPGHGGVVLELDLRSVDFGDWVGSFLDAARPKPPIALPSGLLPTADDVRTALQLLADPAALGSTRLAAKLGMSGADAGPSLLAALRRFIRSEPPAAPLSRASAALLRLLADQPGLGADEAAARLHVSRATYYRHLQQALEQAAAALAIEQRQFASDHAVAPR